MKRIFLLSILVFVLAGCAPAPTQAPETPTLEVTEPPLPTETEAAVLDTDVVASQTASITPSLAPDAWMSMPTFPEAISDQMIEVYRRGLERGRDPERFSKFGDCQNINPYFLTMFDTGDYRLGEQYAYLQPTIDHFKGSWSRDSFAVKSGLNVAAVQTLYWTDPANCGASVSPMECEIKLNNPSLVIISFETWWAGKPATDYENRLRSLIDYLLSQDVVPIVSTKADNMEGDWSINAAIARVATEYGLPLWNFWSVSYPLNQNGLSDGFHLTGFGYRAYFDDPVRMESAWPWRNLTALQTIDAVYRLLNNLP